MTILSQQHLWFPDSGICARLHFQSWVLIDKNALNSNPLTYFSPPPLIISTLLPVDYNTPTQPCSPPHHRRVIKHNLAWWLVFTKAYKPRKKCLINPPLEAIELPQGREGDKKNKKTFLLRSSCVKTLITTWTIIGPVIFLFDSQWAKSVAPVCFPTASKSQLYSVRSAGISPRNPDWVISQPLLWFFGPGLFETPPPRGK